MRPMWIPAFFRGCSRPPDGECWVFGAHMVEKKQRHTSDSETHGVEMAKPQLDIDLHQPAKVSTECEHQQLSLVCEGNTTHVERSRE